MTVLGRRAAITGGLTAAAFTLPAAAQAPDLPFLVIGDWGRDGRYEEGDVALTMGRAAERSRSRFTLSVGDNFYEDGVSGVLDPKWVSSFEAIYTHPALMTPWHVILGNHDYRGSVGAQIAYRGSARWNMPARYYLRSETLSDGTSVDFFHIDTSPFVLAYLGTKTRIGGQDTGAQLIWLERALAASTATWKIVVGHHPLFTATGGKHETAELIQQVKPLLDRYGVRVYLCGHIHNLQETEVDGVRYVTSGAGSKLGPVRQLHRGGFAAETRGFVMARVSRDALLLTYVDEGGPTLHETTILRG